MYLLLFKSKDIPYLKQLGSEENNTTRVTIFLICGAKCLHLQGGRWRLWVPSKR
jgi:hypothetical protein